MRAVVPVPEPELEPDLYRDLLVRTLDHGERIHLHGSPILAAGFEDRRNSIERETGHMKVLDHTGMRHSRSAEQLEMLAEHSIVLQHAVAGLAERVPGGAA